MARWVALRISAVVVVEQLRTARNIFARKQDDAHLALNREASRAHVLLAAPLWVVVVNAVDEARDVPGLGWNDDERRLLFVRVQEAHDIIVVIEPSILGKIDLPNVPVTRR